MCVRVGVGGCMRVSVNVCECVVEWVWVCVNVCGCAGV